MSVIIDIIVPENRSRGQGIPVDFLVEKCIEHGIHDIGSMKELWKVTIIDEDGFEDVQEAPIEEVEELRKATRKTCKFEVESLNKWQIDAN